MKTILNKEIQEYIHANLHSDLHSLLLKKSPFLEVSMQEIVQQIKGKKVAEKKFPFLSRNNVLFPPQLNLEQASSEDTAAYKAQFFKGKSFVDLTCGFGIDAYFLSQNFEKTTLVERDAKLLDVVKYNWGILEKTAIFIHQNLEDFIQNNNECYDLVYLDPARRDENKRKVFLLEDLSPNILEIQDQLMHLGKEVLIKLSPLIDLQHLFQSLHNLHKVWIIAVKNEVKEVLVHLKKSNEQPEVRCINLQEKTQEFYFNWIDINVSKPEFCVPKKYLFIPNNSILKSGAFDLLANKLGLFKLHSNTHLYTNDEILENFPGRVFEIEEIDSKSIQKDERYNLIAKNYPLKPEEIKNKYKLRDGGEDFLIFTQSIKGKHILKAKQLVF